MRPEPSCGDIDNSTQIHFVIERLTFIAIKMTSKAQPFRCLIVLCAALLDPEGRLNFTFLSRLRWSWISSIVGFNVLTWAAVGGSLEIAYQYEYANAADATRSAAKIFSEQVTRVIRSIDSTLLTAAYLIELDPHPNRIRELVESRVLSMDYLVLLTVVDSEARTVGTNEGPDANRTNLSDREHIRVHLDKKVEGLFIGKPVIGRVSGKWSIQLTRAVKKQDGTISHVLVGSLDPFYFSRFWSELGDSSELDLTLVGRDGVILTSNRDTEARLKQGRAGDEILAFAREPANFQQIKGRHEIGMAMPVADSPLFAVARFPPESLQERLGEIRRGYLTVGFALWIVVNASIFLYLRSLAAAQFHENAARTAQTRLQHAVESMSDGFVLYDKDDRLIIANSAFKANFREVGDLISPGRTFSEIVAGIRNFYNADTEPPEMKEWVAKRLSGDLSNLTPVECPVEGGRWIRLDHRRTPDGSIVGVRTDLTDLKRREEDLVASRTTLARQADELRQLADSAQQATRAKSSFVAAVSHELRTPLNAILGFANLLSETRLDEEQSGYVRTLQNSSRHLSQIVNDILDFTRIESGHLHIQPVVFQLKDLISSLRDLTEALIAGGPIAFEVDLAPDLPETFLGDARRISQILINILGNAVKFTSRGRVKLSVHVEDYEPDLCTVVFRCTDSGRGIGPEAIKKLFTPFQQGEIAENLRASGTGLGLVISRGLATLMDGELTVTSEVGVGSTFELRLPLGVRKHDQKTTQLAIRSTPSGIPQSGVLDILVADDAESSRMLCKIILTKRGHRVTVVNDGKQAVESARDRRYDLILMDIEMPGINGRDAVELIRKGPSANSATKIYALTAQAFEEQRDSMLEAGCNGVLTKPFEMDDIEQIISAIGRDRPRQS